MSRYQASIIYNEGDPRRYKYPKVLVLRNGDTEIAFGSEQRGNRNFMLIQSVADYGERAYGDEGVTNTESMYYEPNEQDADIIEVITLK